jgi:hypothetical protein
MRHLIILLLLLSTSCCTNAQKKIRYSGSVEGGILKGSNPANGFVFTTHGITYNQYTFSIGSGIDFYTFRSIPLFVDVKRRFSNKAIVPFVQASAGINFTSSNSTDAKMIYQYAGGGHFNNSFFGKAGGGLIFREQKKLKVSLSAGYSYKASTYKYQAFNGTPWVWQVVPVKDMYHFNRWYIGAGIMW